MALTVATAGAAVALGLGGAFLQRSEDAQAALDEARLQAANGAWNAATRNLERARALVGAVPFGHDLSRDVADTAERIRQGQEASRRRDSLHALHDLATKVRFQHAPASLSAGELSQLELGCRSLWNKRSEISARLTAPGSPLPDGAREDLLDIVLFWIDLRLQLSPAGRLDQARLHALATLEEAARLCGHDAVTAETARQLGGAAVASPAQPQSPWEHAALARLFLRRGLVERAAGEARLAVSLDPQGFWPNFYLGVCAFHQREFADATVAFSVCIGASPGAVCFYNRGRSFAAMNNSEKALADYDAALRRDPGLGAALVNRGVLRLQAGKVAEARADFRQAVRQGEPARVALALSGFLNLQRASTFRETWQSALEILRSFGLFDSQPSHASSTG
jgi:tetratricopeptide (TPR) repeat protein